MINLIVIAKRSTFTLDEVQYIDKFDYDLYHYITHDPLHLNTRYIKSFSLHSSYHLSMLDNFLFIYESQKKKLCQIVGRFGFFVKLTINNAENKYTLLFNKFLIS
jgi:hypothetical protein